MYIKERSGNSLTFHRKGESGPIIGTATYCEGELGSSNIKLVQSSATITLEHIPRRLLFFSPKASFTLDGKRYSWKGLHNLFEEKTSRLVAQYQPMGSNKRLGQLSVSDGDQDFTDMVVVTAFVLQRSTDAQKRAVISIGIAWLILSGIRGLVKGISLSREQFRLAVFCIYYLIAQGLFALIWTVQTEKNKNHKPRHNLDDITRRR